MTLTRRSVLLTAFAVPASLALMSALPRNAQAGSAAVYANDGIAVDGTDVVAYFKDGRPVPGTRAHSHNWNGATWQFSSEANRDAFAANPAKYAPQYGGYCAYAVSEGYTASTVPEAWKIVDGKLYLNYSKRVKRTWEKSQTKRIRDADGNWPKVLN